MKLHFNCSHNFHPNPTNRNFLIDLCLMCLHNHIFSAQHLINAIEYICPFFYLQKNCCRRVGSSLIPLSYDREISFIRVGDEPGTWRLLITFSPKKLYSRLRICRRLKYLELSWENILSKIHQDNRHLHNGWEINSNQKIVSQYSIYSCFSYWAPLEKRSYYM